MFEPELGARHPARTGLRERYFYEEIVICEEGLGDVALAELLDDTGSSGAAEALVRAGRET